MLHILIADDEPQILNLLCQAVYLLGWTCDTAKNGREAIRIMERMPPDLVISDVNMPFVRGVDVVRHMKDNPHLAQIPTILMSSPDVEAEAISSGCTKFIPKPFNIVELTRLLPAVASK
jgi:CheY-like chemotaxis protein